MENSYKVSKKADLGSSQRCMKRDNGHKLKKDKFRLGYTDKLSGTVKHELVAFRGCALFHAWIFSTHS